MRLEDRTEVVICLLGRTHCLEAFIPRSRCCLIVFGQNFGSGPECWLNESRASLLVIRPKLQFTVWGKESSNFKNSSSNFSSKWQWQDRDLILKIKKNAHL